MNTIDEIKALRKIPTKSSKYVGVVWHKYAKKWMAQINVNKKKVCLGYFSDELEAHEIYKKARAIREKNKAQLTQ
jgi:hypothetical protein